MERKFTESYEKSHTDIQKCDKIEKMRLTHTQGATDKQAHNDAKGIQVRMRRDTEAERDRKQNE